MKTRNATVGDLLTAAAACNSVVLKTEVLASSAVPIGNAATASTTGVLAATADKQSRSWRRDTHFAKEFHAPAK